MLTAIRTYLKPGPGYSRSGSTKLKVELFADDGTVYHRPFGPALASHTWTQINSFDHTFDATPLDASLLLEIDGLYHLYFSNMESQPDTSYTSLNFLYDTPPHNPRQPFTSNTDLATLSYLDTTSHWIEETSFAPIYPLIFADSTLQGHPYMDVYARRGLRRIFGPDSRVRERFTVSGQDQRVITPNVFVRKTGNPTFPLCVRLETDAGNEI